MRDLYPASQSEFSISDIVRASTELSAHVAASADEGGARDLGSPMMVGRLLATEVQPGLFASGRDITFLNEDELTVEMESGISLSVLLSGACSPITIAGHEDLRFEPDRSVLFAAGTHLPSTIRWKANEAHVFAGFLLQPSFFERFGDGVSDDGLVELRNFGAQDFRCLTLPKSPRITTLARQIMTHPYGPELGALFLEASTLSLVIEAADALSTMSRIMSRVGLKHYERVMQAREILDVSFADPPTTLALARQVGSNVATLQSSFRAAFGVGIFGYVRLRRLEEARTLLHDTDLQIAEIGRRVGFLSPAAFSAAFRRHFGEPPSRDAGRRKT